MYHTYILYSKSIDRYYTGHTSVGVRQRLERHNNEDVSSTKHGTPWEIKYCKAFETKTEAMKWENFIKRQKSRSFKERLIDGEDNDW